MSAVAPSTRHGRTTSPSPVGGSPAPLLAEGVVKSFAGERALDRVELRVGAGEIVGLVGPNGSGKTTLLGAAAGLLRIDAGSIRIAGSPAGSRAARAATALVPDEPTGLDELTVAEFISLVHRLWEADAAAAGRALMLSAAFGLDRRRHERLGTLSRGLRRQASGVAALSLAPPLLLVDEATATLDPEAVVVLREAVASLAARGCGVLLATQDLHFASAVCHTIALLHRGRVIDRGAPGVLCTRYGASSLEEVFLAAVGDGRLPERVRCAFAAH